MAEAQEQQARSGQPAQPRRKSASSTSLLQKEFKPKTRPGASEAVEAAVRTLAEQALADTPLISDDAVRTIEAMIAEIDRKLTEQINLILHHEDFQAAGRRLARPALPGQQHRDRRDAQDPRDEHLQEGPGARPSRSSRARPGTRARCSRSSTRRSTARSAASPTAAWSATTTSTTRRRTSRCWRGMAQIAAAAHAPFIAGAPPSADEHGVLAGAGQPARPDQDLPDAGVRRLAVAARVGRLPLHRPDHAALPGPPALRRQDQPGRGVRLRGRHRGRRPQQVRLGQLRLRHGAPTSTASFKLYGWCSRIRGVE